MTLSSWSRVGTSSAAVVALMVAVAIGVVLCMPAPALEWETVVVPSAVEYMKSALKVEESSVSTISTISLDQPLQGMFIAVTGATSGIGLGLTRKLLALGATVVAIGRSPQKLQRLQETYPGIETVLADFSDLESIARASQYMLEHYDHLDVLVNNAGIHTGVEGNFRTWTSSQGHDLPFAVNYLSHFLLTERLMPLLQNSQHATPKVVQVSSRFHFAVDGSDLSTYGGTQEPIASQEGGSRGFAFFRSQRQYGNSKMAQILHARSLQEQYGSKIRAVSACPTWVGTQIIGASTSGTWVHSLFESTAFPMDGFGLSSILHAILDTPKGDDDDDDDFYINSFGFGGISGGTPVDRLPAWTYQWLPIRDVLVGGSAFSFVYVLQRFFATRDVARSSLPTYDKTLQEELYTWSRQAVSPWL